MTKVAAIIPARYASTRFPGKMLALLCGKPMIQHVYEKAVAASSIDQVLVAADSTLVIDAIKSFGGNAVMTGEYHQSGTDRIAEAIQSIDCDVIINVQGDEPLIPSSVIDELANLMKSHPEIDMATVAVPASRDALADPNKVKVIFGVDQFAMYFSRSVIPFLRQGGDDTPCFLHWGIYAYRRSALEKLVRLPQSKFEKCEKLEQLRALENNIRIYVLTSDLTSVGVDTPEDLIEAEKRMKSLEGN